MSHPLNKSWHSPEFSCFDLLSMQYRGFYIFKKYLETLIFSTVRIKLNLKNYIVGKTIFKMEGEGVLLGILHTSV